MRPETLLDLKSSGYRPRSVKEEIRENVIKALERGDTLFPGIIGYESTVTPAIVNALLARHDIVLLGLRGQAKTRILRSLTEFLDPEIPVIEGAPLNDDPLAPISPEGRRLVEEHGDRLRISWQPRDRRYQEKLATPDVTMADLIGDLDPVKAASRGRSLIDEEAVAYGIVPRANRGVFSINELPDLAPRIQVALLNVMEERDVQIRGFPVRIPLDLLLVFSANPEDYTKRGNLITPLRDRIAAQIHTHYPKTIEDGRQITEQEAWMDRGAEVLVPSLARDIVEEVANEARASDWVDQSSGVSARLTIALLETVASNAERRALVCGAKRAVVRLSDFYRAIPAITGKLELVFEGEREGPESVATHLIGKAAQSAFDRFLPDYFGDWGDEPSPYGPLAAWFKKGGKVEVDDAGSDEAAREALHAVPGLVELANRYLSDVDDEADVFAMELVLEGLHQHAVLAKEAAEGGTRFTGSSSSFS
ncbi:MAG: AAA family ATPase [Planctomycetota bacterium]|jgi:magnesium chelatase subunit I